MFCKNCGNHLSDDATFCEACWTPLQYPKQEQRQFNNQQVSSEDKLFGALAYLLGLFTIIIGFCKKDSKFVLYHVNTALSASVTYLIAVFGTMIISGIITFIAAITGSEIVLVIGIIVMFVIFIFALWFFAIMISGIIFAIKGKEQKLPIALLFKFFK